MKAKKKKIKKKRQHEQIATHLPIVAAFDFDGTLTHRDTLLPFLLFVCGRFKTICKLLLLLPFLSGYVMGLISRQETKERVLSFFFQGMPIEQLRAYGARFLQERMPQLLKTEALNRLKWHQEQGHRCILVSASVDIYLEQWGSQAGFDDVVCSQLQTDDAKVTGKLIGNNCWGIEKRRRLEALLGDREKYCLYAYGDSRGDLELLSFADYSFYRKMPI